MTSEEPEAIPVAGDEDETKMDTETAATDENAQVGDAKDDEAADATATTAEGESAESGIRSKKRPRSPSEPAGTTDTAPAAPVSTASVTAAAAAAAAQLCASMGLQGLYALLSVTALRSNAPLPTVAQVQEAAQKTLTDQGPSNYVHWSKTDSAPQLTVGGGSTLAGSAGASNATTATAASSSEDSQFVHVQGGLRGYRMSRASHGVSDGHYYFEMQVLEPPKVSEIVDSLPSNVRLSSKLQQAMDTALQLEREGKASDPAGFGAHVRLGISNRTGDLQAPVGYDKWSYGIRDIGGSKIHQSRRDDDWGGLAFGPGDIIGCAISLQAPATDAAGGTAAEAAEVNGGGATSKATEANGTEAATSSIETSYNQLRFYKNGQAMGHPSTADAAAKAKEGSVAFGLPSGVYYPAVSLYMGAKVRLNAGPYFVYPPRRLPISTANGNSTVKLKPFGQLASPPISWEDAIGQIQKDKPFRKADILQHFQELVKAELDLLHQQYQEHRAQHLRYVQAERQARGLTKKDDLEGDDFYEQVTAAMEPESSTAADEAAASAEPAAAEAAEESTTKRKRGGS